MAKRVYAEVDLSAICHNVCQIRKKIEDKKLIAVIKADGYGHGSIETAKAIADKVDAFAVATKEEALEIKEAGIDKPILILAPIPKEDIKECLLKGVSLTVGDMNKAKEISEVSNAEKITAKLHLAVDTGMTRIGFMPTDESLNEIKEIANLPFVEIEGIFSHYATADEKDKEYSLIQTKRFMDFVKKVEELGIKPMRHIANSAGLIEFEIFGDAVRAGIVMYGLYPSSDVKKDLDLRPAIEWKSRVSAVRKVEKGIPVSYGRTFVTDKEMTIATVSAGYGDGYPRMLSNIGRVLIKGKSYPIIGRVCMDQFMIDVTGGDVECEDEVILIGKSGDEYISAEEIASLTGTINYEIICNIGNRVPRIIK